MRYYETLYLINPNLSDEEYQSVLAKFNGIIEENKGVIVKVEEWGKRPLAYLVRKFDKGFYVLISHCGGPDIVKELNRTMKLDDRIFKYQTIKLRDSADPEALKVELEKIVATEPKEILYDSNEIAKDDEGEEGDYEE